MSVALQYQRIKSFIESSIEQGDWVSGNKVPSENELAERFSVSRMTVNRAMKELEADGIVERVQGKGTFVAPPRPLSSVLQILGIDDEIRARGGQYSCTVLHQKSVTANQELSVQLGTPEGTELWTSSIVHFENKIPVQLEQRWVKPAVWKDYLEQDFSRQTPHAYLSQTPFSRGEHTIEAVLPDARLKRLLKLTNKEAVLLIHRRTWVKKTIASYVKLFHPGNRFQITTALNHYRTDRS